MIELLITILLSILIYLLPGYMLLQWFNFKNLSFLNRLIFSLVASLILVPYASILFANFVPFKPGLLSWTILVLVLLIPAGLLQITRRKIPLSLQAGPESPFETSRIPGMEIFGALVFMLAFAAFANLPRVLMFIQGGYALDIQPWDENWHIQQLVSVARTGIPPRHYFFPTLELAYYYASWILPAILGNLPGLAASLLRLMSMHVFFQVFAFLGLVYVWLQVNVKNGWARILGLAFFTILGGFDLFAKLPGIEFIDWWPKDPSWLSGNLLINQFATLFGWVPHHLAAGMAFLVLVLVWRNIQASRPVKLIGSGILFGFVFITSPFIFVFTCLAVAIVLLASWKTLWVHRKSTLLALLVVGFFFAVVAWYPALVYSSHSGSLTWNDVRVNVLERFRGGDRVLFWGDRALTILGLPITMSAFLLVDIGLAYVFYVLWWGQRVLARGKLFPDLQALFSGLFPVASFLLVLLVKDIGGGGNFSMRGFIPAQTVLILTAVLWADTLHNTLQDMGWKRWFLLYALAGFFVAQGFSTLAEVRSLAVEPLKLAIWEDCGWKTLFRPRENMETCLPQDRFRYIYWLNEHTPPDALILETGTLPQDAARFRWLERNRILMPSEFMALEFNYFDMDFILPDDWEHLNDQWEGVTGVLEYYQASDFPRKESQPVYLVLHAGAVNPTESDMPIYQDEYVRIFNLRELALPQGE